MPDDHAMFMLVPPAAAPGPLSQIGASIVGDPAPRGRLAESLVNASTRGRNAFVLVTVIAIVLGAWPFHLTMPYWLLALGVAHYAIAVTTDVVRGEMRVRAGRPFTLPLRPEVRADRIVAHDLRAAYEAILAGHEELRRTLAASPSMQRHLRTTFDRCAAAVHGAGRLALLGNPIHDYDRKHDRKGLLEEHQSAGARAAAVTDPEAARLYRETAAIRAQHLATHDRLHDLRDRIHARLELTRATIDAVQVLAVKLAAAGGEHLERADELHASRLQSIYEEVAVLESTLDEMLAA